MILSADRQSHLAHLISDGLWKDELIDFSNEELAIRVCKKSVVEFVKETEEIDKKARATVASLKRNVVEGSSEWDILYSKYFEEELNRRGLS